MNKWRICVVFGILFISIIRWFIPALKSLEWVGFAVAWFAIGRISAGR